MHRDDFPFPSIIHFSCCIPPENRMLIKNFWVTNLWSSTIRSMITKRMIFKIKQKISSVFIRQHFLKLEFFDEVPPQIRKKVNNDSTNDFLYYSLKNDSYLQSLRCDFTENSHFESKNNRTRKFPSKKSSLLYFQH